MTSAPSVNQIRFLSSSALAKAPQLTLAASCSAADAMQCSVRALKIGTCSHRKSRVTLSDHVPKPPKPEEGRAAVSEDRSPSARPRTCAPKVAAARTVFKGAAIQDAPKKHLSGVQATPKSEPIAKAKPRGHRRPLQTTPRPK